jgi:transposase
VIQAPKLEPRIKAARHPRVSDRRVLNGIFWVLRSGAPWRDLPESYGPPTTCYDRFARWRRAGVWNQIMDALATTHAAAVQMIDTSIVRVHQHGLCRGNKQQHMLSVLRYFSVPEAVKGVVHVFDLDGNRKATRAYGGRRKPMMTAGIAGAKAQSMVRRRRL